MPRYFFNIRSEAMEEIDMVGRACADDLAALGEALATAGRVVRKRLQAENFSPAGSIEVEDERHRVVLSLPLRAAAY